MGQYVLAGLALGSIYAIASAGLVITFVSAGVLNFAFGSMAYVCARVYYWLNTQHGLSTTTSALISLLLFAPALGLLLYGVLFRFIRGRSTLVKLVTTIGLSVALPAITDLIFTNQTIDSAPGLASVSDKPFHFLGTPVTTDQVITYGFLLFVVIGGTALLRFTDIGLRVRALVDSEAMTSLSGTNPGTVSLGVWAVSSALAGLAGILVAPSQGLSTTGMTTLMAASFAAVVAARLRSIPIALAASLAMGVVTDVIQKYLPANSSLTAAIVPSIPFGFIVAFLVFYIVRAGSLREAVGPGSSLDQAVRPASTEQTSPDLLIRSARSPAEKAISAVPLAMVVALPLIFHGSAYWLGLTATGLCYAITFLTYTVVTGEGGMLWLSQIIFAGAGALGAAQFVKYWHVPVLSAIFLGAVVAGLAGALIGVLTLRLGDLYVGLVTLSFGLLVEGLIFTRPRFSQQGLGVPLNPPAFARGQLAFCYLAVATFLILAAITLNLRRSTTGLALRAVSDSEPAARTLGLSVVQIKVIAGALAAFIAAIGGGFLAMNQGLAQPTSFETFLGLAWLAVAVTLGVRSIIGAGVAGLSFSLTPGLFQTYIPTRLGEIPTILFGLGAIGVALHPEGVVLQQGRQIRRLLSGLMERDRPAPSLPAATKAAP
ncbi:MAG TPA: ABC transporter permease [Acidimicrobiales bacterium]|nr:ABC transporter permease [Acidimicrobiales bacterium]